MKVSQFGKFQEANTSQHQLLREECIGQVFIVKVLLLRENNKKQRITWARKHKEQTLNQWKSVRWSDESRYEDLGCCERQKRWVDGFYLCGSHCEAWRKRCDCVEVLYSEFKAHLISSLLQQHTILPGLHLVGLAFVVNRTMTPNTPSGYVKAIWPKGKQWNAASDHLT